MRPVRRRFAVVTVWVYEDLNRPIDYTEVENYLGGLVQLGPLIYQQGALTRVGKTLPSLPLADFLGTVFPPQEARGKEGSIFTTSLLPD